MFMFYDIRECRKTDEQARLRRATFFIRNVAYPRSVVVVRRRGAVRDARGEAGERGARYARRFRHASLPLDCLRLMPLTLPVTLCRCFYVIDAP